MKDLASDRCPRCGGSFHCGAQDAHCDCFDLKLSPELRDRLAREYEGCLCIRCLKALQQGLQEPPETLTTPARVPRA